MNNRLVHLDCLRGVAGLLVVMSHLRAFLFVPFAQLKSPGLLVKVFFLVTGFGHQAVMIFFVLSGYLVGGSVISSLQSEKWAWKEYLLRRMSRLWVVLIPALLLTLFWDKLGHAYAPCGYEGVYRGMYNSGPTPSGPEDLSSISFFGNVFFLQTILVPCFGTNGPLWSLVNEFWYYILFPSLLTIFLSRKWKARALSITIAIAIVVFLPKSILMAGLIWLLGALSYCLIQNQSVVKITKHPLWFILGLFLTLGSLLLSRREFPGELSDLFIGIGCAVLVTGLVVKNTHSHFYRCISVRLADMTYTLYLGHFPLLAFLFFVFFNGWQMVPDLKSAFAFSGLFILILAYAFVMWWLFERNTDCVRRFIAMRLISTKCTT